MAETLAHRGPDSDGLWQDPDVPLVLGHQRLAILDLSPEGHQPMLSDSAGFAIAYNGEIYNYLDLKKELELAGLSFKGRSDTEVILGAVEHWGLNLALQKLNGMFAFALWDRKQRQLHFVRDRLGKKPLYIGWAGDMLVFGSELKALRAHSDFKAETDRDVLGLYMRYGFIPAPHCIYKNVWSLPAGFRLTLNIQNLKPGAQLSSQMETYWHPLRVLEEARQRPVKKSESQIILEFEELLTSCVRDRMISDVPLGAFLSGGIDSSTVVALMQKISSRPVKTYTIGFHENGFDEATYAAKVAAHLGTDHHALYISPEDALDTIPRLPEIYDEPFADISAIPTFLVSRFARNDVTVALSGDGGDEMLGGYNRHVMGPKIMNRMRLVPRPLRKILAGAIEKIPTQKWDDIADGRPQSGSAMHKAAAIMALDTPEDIYTRLLSQWPQPPVPGAISLPLLQDRAEWQSSQNLSLAEKMMYWDALFYLPGDILTKVDRASMAVGLEARAPLLDRRIYEYVWRLPETLKIRDARGKYLLREVLARHLPRDLFERPKQGFNMPIGAWLRGPLKDWAEDLLDEDAMNAQGFFDAKSIRNIWQAHLNGHGNHAGQLWTVLMFQAWQKRWL